MIVLAEVVASLYGVYRLARLDARGLELFNRSLAGARRSFWAAALVAPMYALIVGLLPPERAQSGGLHWLLVEAIAYIVSWVAYPVVAEALSRPLGCRERFEAYLSAYNWSMVLQNAVLLPVVMLTAFGLLPPSMVQLLWLAVIAAIMGYLWFIARAALAVSGMTAAGLVVLDQLLSAVIEMVVNGLS